MMLSKAARTAIYAGAVLLAIGSVEGAASQTLANHVPEAVHESRPVGPVAPAARLNLAIGLPLRNAAELDVLVEQIADPQSIHYRQYLSASEFAERFGPTQADYEKLIAFAKASGLEVSATHPNRMILDVAGQVGAINRALHINLTVWDHPTRGQFFAPDRAPSLDTDVQVLTVSGLDNFLAPRPMDLKLMPMTSALPLVTGSGPSGLFIGKDFRAAYAPGVTLTGAGQKIGLVEFDGFYAADVVSNFKQAGLPAVPVSTVLLDGFNGAPGSGNIEVILDIVMAGYMAPGASVIVYEGYYPDDVLNRMATDNSARQLSCSWGYGIDSTTEQIFKEMIAQGQSFFTASGDSGAYTNGVMAPADNPNVTSVGGTALTTAGVGGAWQSESAWSGSGGGVSTTYPIPSYQQTTNVTAAGGSGTMRNMPDVALTGAVQMYLIYNNGSQTAVGGTSAATPLWTAFTSLANQQAAANGKPVIGFMNPAIYALGNNSANYAATLHDITTGNTGFAARAGYDLTTGWGSPAGQALINNLASPSTTPSFTLAATPGTATVQAGSTTTSTIQETVLNGFSAAVTLSVTGLPSGVTGTFGSFNSSHASVLTLSSTSGTVPGTYPILVQGVSGNITSIAAISLVVTAVTTPATFSLAASAPALSIVQAASGTSTITVTTKAGFTGKVSLAVLGLPAGVTASFSAASTATTSVITFAATSAAAVGTSTVTVTGIDGAASATATLSLTIKTGPSFTLAASPSSVSVTQGASGSSTIAVTPLNGFTGTLAFAVTGLPAGITAAFTGETLKLTASSTAVAGSTTLIVTGTSGALSAQASIALTVASSAGFNLSPSVSNVSVAPSGKGTSVLTVTAKGGFTGAVSLSAVGLPAGVTASFSPVSTATSSTLTLTATSAAVAKAYQFTVNGVAGSLTSTLAMTVTVTPPGDFSIALAPSSLHVIEGGKGTTAITLTPLNGFAGTVVLSASGLPAGVTAAFTVANSGVLALFTVGSAAAVGTTQVNVTATSGALVHTAVLSLTVLAPTATTTTVDLSPSYNVSGIAVDNLPFTSGGLDAGGRSYSGNLLGASQTVAGTLYAIGPMGLPDAVSEQTLALPAGQFASLKMLATGVNGNQLSQKFTVTYTDGTIAAITQSVSDWFTPQNYSSEVQAVTMSYRDNNNATTDGEVFHLYAYSLPLNSAKTVRSITLPQNRNVVVVAITLSTK